MTARNWECVNLDALNQLKVSPLKYNWWLVVGSWRFRLLVVGY
ncbi:MULTISPECIES: hypothetical protein [Chroococcidiopsis]|nr:MULTISPECIES: hypothetical protein [Chroococcidiopsis]